MRGRFLNTAAKLTRTVRRVGNGRSCPVEFHTVEGIDALKQSIRDIKDQYQLGTPEWKVVDQAERAMKATITEQAPGTPTS